MNTTDTICAIASGVGGAVSIVRVSGADALKIGNAIWRGRSALSMSGQRKMMLGKIVASGESSLAVYMPNPHSYTGEDVVEIQLHGGALPAKTTLNAAIDAGARMAEPGEFTFRAFVNGKLDLTQAEAVGEIISAGSKDALLLASRQLSGALSEKIRKIRQELTDILGDLESRLDFPEEHIDWESGNSLTERIETILIHIAKLSSTFTAGKNLREGVRVMLAGRPNVGKSSLMNALLGRDRAIVSAIAGTTRDTLEELTELRRIPVRITDTAGIRRDASDIEALGIERSIHTLKTSEIIFWLLDATAPVVDFSDLANVNAPIIAVWNKCDMPHDTLPELPYVCVEISAATGMNLELLLNEFEKAVWHGGISEAPEVAVNARQLAELNNTVSALTGALPEIEEEFWELAAVQLRLAVNALGEITGETAGVDVLDNIFSRFCIGK